MLPVVKWYAERTEEYLRWAAFIAEKEEDLTKHLATIDELGNTQQEVRGLEFTQTLECIANFMGDLTDKLSSEILKTALARLNGIITVHAEHHVGVMEKASVSQISIGEMDSLAKLLQAASITWPLAANFSDLQQRVNRVRESVTAKDLQHVFVKRMETIL